MKKQAKTDTIKNVRENSDDPLLFLYFGQSDTELDSQHTENMMTRLVNTSLTVVSQCSLMQM
jgi:hypothetical protein